MTEKEYEKEKKPYGYSLTLKGIESIDRGEWTTLCGHLCFKCKQEIFKNSMHDLEKSDC